MIQSKRALILIVVFYWILMVLTPVFLAMSSAGYEAKIIGPLPDGYSGVVRLLSYDPSNGSMLFRISSSKGPGLLILNTNNKIFIQLNETIDPSKACIIKNDLFILPKHHKYFIYFKLNQYKIYIYKVNLIGISGLVTHSRIECSDSPIVILTIKNQTIIFKPDINDPIKPSMKYSVKVSGSLIDTTLHNNLLFVALKYKKEQKILILDSKNGGINNSFLIPNYLKININKIIYTDDLYILGSWKNSAKIYVPRTIDVYTITYNSTGKVRVETVVHRNHRIVALVRPPAAWMQILEIDKQGKTANIELFSPYMYSFLSSEASNEGNIDIIGLIYNNTQRYISLLRVIEDKRATIGYPLTYFDAKPTQLKPTVTRYEVKYKPITASVQPIDGNLTLIEEKIKSTIHELDMNLITIHDSRETLRHCFTLFALVTPLIYLVYLSITISFQTGKGFT